MKSPSNLTALKDLVNKIWCSVSAILEHLQSCENSSISASNVSPMGTEWEEWEPWVEQQKRNCMILFRLLERYNVQGEFVEVKLFFGSVCLHMSKNNPLTKIVVLINALFEEISENVVPLHKGIVLGSNKEQRKSRKPKCRAAKNPIDSKHIKSLVEHSKDLLQALQSLLCQLKVGSLHESPTQGSSGETDPWKALELIMRIVKALLQEHSKRSQSPI